MAQKLVGIVIHFYPKISVAVVDVKDNIKKGDKISIVKGDSNLQQIVSSMQIDYKPIEEAEKGQIIGLKVDSEVKEGAQVFKEIVEKTDIKKQAKKVKAIKKYVKKKKTVKQKQNKKSKSKKR